MLTIAGSGPSTTDYDQRVTVATKKRSVPSDYVFCRFGFHYPKWGGGEILPLMLYYQRCKCMRSQCPECNLKLNFDFYRVDGEKWDKYWQQFIRMKDPVQRVKPSLGMCAVFGVVERWQPDEIGLIGFDSILDGDTAWRHDAIAEKACIESLVKIIDLRQGS